MSSFKIVLCKKSFDSCCLDFHEIGWGHIKGSQHHQLYHPPALFPTPSESDTQISQHTFKRKYMRKKWQQWCSGRILSQHGKRAWNLKMMPSKRGILYFPSRCQSLNKQPLNLFSDPCNRLITFLTQTNNERLNYFLCFGIAAIDEAECNFL